MDDLISRKDAVSRISDLLILELKGARIPTWNEVYNAIGDIPSDPAVPLDKLCEWLNVHCGRPNYCNDRLCGKCNLDGEGFEYETCWKTLLTEWMEEQNA